MKMHGSHLPTPLLPPALANKGQPPSAIGPSPTGVISHRQTRVLIDDSNLTVRQINTTFTTDTGKALVEKEDTLEFETRNTADTIFVRQPRMGDLNVEVNGRHYSFKVNTEGDKDEQTKLHFKTHGGDDRLKIDAEVEQQVTVEAGDGNDDVQAGGGTTYLFGGRGNDTLRLGSGAGYAEGNEGHDTLIGGTGNTTLYGNNGNDRLYAGAGPANKINHLDGGDGADKLFAGNGHNVLNGGLGEDLLVGHDRTTFYSGNGQDRIWSGNRGDRIYAKTSDHLVTQPYAKVTFITPNDAGKEGFDIQGTPDEKQRIEDDFELLRSSPTGQKMLTEMDAAARSNGAPVRVVSSDEMRYHYADQQIPDYTGGPDEHFIREGARGERVTTGVIEYNPVGFIENPVYQGTPITNFYHEMAHAYNGATGSFLPGSSSEKAYEDPTIIPPTTTNLELQAVGLSTQAPPFEFDDDPLTPPTSTNPTPFTENGLREEMGHIRRESYEDRSDT